MREDCKWKKLSNNILSLSQEAAAAKALNPNIINAIIGMLNDADNSFYTFKAVSEVLKEVKRVLGEIAEYKGEMPGASEIECGNFRNLDVEVAKAEAARYLAVIKDETAKQINY